MQKVLGKTGIASCKVNWSQTINSLITYNIHSLKDLVAFLTS